MKFEDAIKELKKGKEISFTFAGMTQSYSIDGENDLVNDHGGHTKMTVDVMGILSEDWVVSKEKPMWMVARDAHKRFVEDNNYFADLTVEYLSEQDVWDEIVTAITDEIAVRKDKKESYGG